MKHFKKGQEYKIQFFNTIITHEMKDYKLFTPANIGLIELRNHIVMAPMTRCRAIGNIPNELMLKYYKQRSGAGLIITEGTSPSPNGLGYARIPGIFTLPQIEGWKKITSAIHDEGGKIFIQLMHSGRISHSLNMPPKAKILAPSAVQPAGQMWTDSEQLQDYPKPAEMSLKDISNTITEYQTAAKNAITAGFDGVELHAANGYLPEQFLSPSSNLREDNYGGNIQKRCRFVIEIATEIAKAIGKEKTGIRISPYGVAGDMPLYNETDSTYKLLTEELDKLGIAYIHIVDHSSLGSPAVSPELKKNIRKIFKNTIILSGGYTVDKAEIDIQKGLGDLVAFGRPFINNPDLVERFKNGWPLSKVLSMKLFYSADAEGYTDYPVFVK